jgi:hypothetical protein
VVLVSLPESVIQGGNFKSGILVDVPGGNIVCNVRYEPAGLASAYHCLCVMGTKYLSSSLVPHRGLEVESPNLFRLATT